MCRQISGQLQEDPATFGPEGQEPSRVVTAGRDVAVLQQAVPDSDMDNLAAYAARLPIGDG
jgi:hypothetical protein